MWIVNYSPTPQEVLAEKIQTTRDGIEYLNRSLKEDMEKALGLHRELKKLEDGEWQDE